MSQIFSRRWSVWMADSMLAKFPVARPKWEYDFGVICRGLEMVWELTGDNRYFDYIRQNMDRFVQEDGSIPEYDASANNLDHVNNGKALLFLYRHTGEEKYRRAAELLRRQLTVHPRVRAQFYKGSVDIDSFRFAAQKSKLPLCYNGSLFSAEDCRKISAEFPNVQAVMLGRALIADPGMRSENGTTPRALEAFHNELLEAYTEAFGGSRNAMFRLKENWRYWLCRFENSEKLGKQLRKATDLAVYKSITHEIFHNLPLQPLQPDWD